MSSAWFAFRITPTREEKTHAHLLRLGIVSLFAHERSEQRRRHPTRRSVVTITRTVPLLPGYALARCEDASRIDAWLSALFGITVYGGPTKGHVRLIRAVVGAEGRPTPIPLHAIERLEAMSGTTRALPRPAIIKAGSKARLTAGPMAGATVQVEEVRGRRARVLLGLFGTVSKVTVKLDQMEAA